MNKRQMLGAVVAMAAASVVLSGTTLAESHAEKKGDKKVKCMGNNACAGKGACGAADGTHACAGKNSCKGKGWTMVASEEECTKGGGKVAKEEKKDAPKKG